MPVRFRIDVAGTVAPSRLRSPGPYLTPPTAAPDHPARCSSRQVIAVVSFGFSPTCHGADYS